MKSFVKAMLMILVICGPLVAIGAVAYGAFVGENSHYAQYETRMVAPDQSILIGAHEIHADEAFLDCEFEPVCDMTRTVEADEDLLHDPDQQALLRQLLQIRSAALRNAVDHIVDQALGRKPPQFQIVPAE